MAGQRKGSGRVYPPQGHKVCWPPAGGNGGEAAPVIWLHPEDFSGVTSGDNPPNFTTFTFAAAARLSLPVIEFRDNRQEAASCAFAMPSNWDKGDLKVRLYWFVDSASHTTNYEWRVEASCIGDAEAIEQARATVNNFDLDAASRTLYITSEATVTPSTGTDDNGMICFGVTRLNDAASGSGYFCCARIEYGTT